MERRILLAFTLSFLVFVLYMRWFGPRPEDVPVRYPEERERKAVERAPETVPDVTKEPPSRVRREQVRRQEGVQGERHQADGEQSIEVDTDLYHAVFTNRGASLRSLVLKNYANEEGGLYEMVPQEASRRLGVYPLEVELGERGDDGDGIQDALFEASSADLVVRGDGEGELRFLWADGRGLEVRKTIHFHGGSYVLDVLISARRGGKEVRKRVLFGPGSGDESREGRYRQPEKGIIRVGDELRFYGASDIDKGEGVSVDVGAVGVASHYFIGLMVPERGAAYGARLWKKTLEPENGESKKRDYITAALEAADVPAAFELFIGPKEHDRLAQLAPGMERAIDYGWMRYLALPLRAALLWIDGFVGNYGWSIVLLTVLINVALIPLKHHSYVSMRKMQKLAPQIKRIQERYKKLKPTDPRQQDKNREVMELYKQHNVSPISGCLPMLLMIPFFFAFYRLLMVSIELRHAPFGGWIHDLSTNDPYFVLPILMGVTQIAVQKMSPQTSADPMQAKLMMIMPIMFVFILAWAPAGLVLYWFVNNLVSIAQQKVTNRLLDEGESGKAASRPAGGKSKRGKKKSSRS